MALTKYFKDTVVKCAQHDQNFREALLEQAISEFISGDLHTSKLLLRDYINARMSFAEISQKTRINNKSLQRMLGPHGNPTTNNFCSILQAIQKVEGFAIDVKIQH